MNLNDLIEKQKLIICCGAGGVGKTTTAAALGVKAALLGKKVVVLTIDPAKRLANSLGLNLLSSDEKEIRSSEFEKFDLKPTGQLFALMLDTKRTFDKIIERYAPNADSKKSILQNPLYQHLSNMIAGSQEYMAMEKVFEIYEKKKYDLLILDTPPTRHALDFLDAPQKMTRAVTESMIKWLLKPSLFLGRSSLRLLGKSMGRIFKTFDKVIGIEFLQDLSMMLISTAGLLEGFKDRAKDVSKLLRDSQTSFLLVTSPAATEEAIFFHKKILEYKLPFEGFIVNQVHEIDSDLEIKELRKTVSLAGLNKNQEEKASEVVENFMILVNQDKKSLKLLESKKKKKEKLILVPALENDVHDLQGLAKIASYL